MKTKFKNNSYYYKYLISYVFILIVPILFIGFYVNGSIFRTLEEEVITNDLNALNQLHNNIESTLEQTRKITEGVYLGTYRAPFLFKQDPLRGVELIDELKSYTVTNPFLEDVFLHFIGDNYIYRSTGSAPVNMFLEEIYHFDNWAQEDILETFSDLNKPIYRPSETIILNANNPKEMTSIIYPLYAAGVKPYAVLLFSISTEYFEKSLHDKVNIEGKVNVILNNNGDIIAMTKVDHIEKNDVEELISSSDYHGREVMLNRETYLMAMVEAQETGWRYVSLTPKSYINNRTRGVRFGFFLGIMLVFIVGVVSIILSMRMNYGPIRKLKKYSASFIDGDEQARGELELVREAIDNLHDRNEALSDEVEHSSEANRQYIAMQILRGTTPMDRNLQQKAERYGVRFDEMSTVAIIYVDSNADYALTRKDIIEQAKDIFSEGMNIYACEHFDARKIILILSFGQDLHSGLQSKLELVQKSIKSQYNVSTTVGFGNAYEERELIPKAYIEALTAVDYRLVKGNGCVIHYKDIIESQTAAASYPQDNLYNISALLKAGNIDLIEKEVDLIITYIKSNNTPIFIAKGLCFDIINSIFRTSQEIVGEFYSVDLDIPDVFALAQYDTVDELAEIIKELSHELCSQVINQKEKEELSLIHEMVVYIKNNYTDCNFSLNGMADFFNMSQSALSMYFKDKTEQKILDYITRMKLDKAKELLLTTNIPLSKLSEAVGYANVTSFIRRFKQLEHITPGEFRKKYS